MIITNKALRIEIKNSQFNNKPSKKLAKILLEMIERYVNKFHSYLVNMSEIVEFSFSFIIDKYKHFNWRVHEDAFTYFTYCIDFSTIQFLNIKRKESLNGNSTIT